MDATELLARLSVPDEARGPLANQLAVGLAKIRARWADAPAIGDAFIAHLGERIAKQDGLVSALPRLNVDDLFLAWWAGSGDPRGIAAFEHAFAPDLDKLTARFHRLQADELRQQLRIKLFVGSPKPRIHDYSGFGFLQNWLKVTAARSFIDAARAERSRRYEDELDDRELAGLIEAVGDPRDVHQRAQLSGAVKRAFAAAVATLSQRERAFLRAASVDRRTLDQIAADHAVHRATVARTLAAARERLLAMTRERLAGELGLASQELQSAVRALDSQLELSLSRVLKASG